MKRTIIFCALFLFGCSSERGDWDSGASAEQADQQQRMEEQTESVRNQMPESRPATELDQPF